MKYFQITPVETLTSGERLFVELEGRQIMLLNLGGEIHAIGDVCTHDNGELGDGEIEEHEIICPRHGARFDIMTGKVRGLPAVVDIPTYPVRISEGVIEIGLPED